VTILGHDVQVERKKEENMKIEEELFGIRIRASN
jgi:hypothetical protein